jgi:hypothetical protein
MKNKPPVYLIPDGPHERARRSMVVSNGDTTFVDTTSHDPIQVRATVKMYYNLIIQPSLSRVKEKHVGA